MLTGVPPELLTHIALYVALPSSLGGGPPSSLIPLMLTNSAIHSHLRFQSNPVLYASILSDSWDLGASKRRYGSTMFEDSRVLAEELRHRWRLLHRIHRLAGPFSNSIVFDERQAETDMMELLLLLTENDGMNVEHIVNWAHIWQYLSNLHNAVILPECIQPGYMRERPLIAAAFALTVLVEELLTEKKERIQQDASYKIAYQTLLNEKARMEREIEEKMFVLRPFAVARNKYDAFFAPWNMKRLVGRSRSAYPVDAKDIPSPGSHQQLITLQRFGRSFVMVAPITSISSILGALSQLDKVPTSGGAHASTSNSSTLDLSFLYTPEERAQLPAGPIFYDPITALHIRRTKPMLSLPSACFDIDILRLAVCADTTVGTGLAPMSMRGKIEGTWLGGFSYFDFNGYRKLLDGNLKSLYEHSFGQQGQELVVYETVVRTRKELIGGSGSPLNAGFPTDDEDPDQHVVLSFEDATEPEPEGSEYEKEILLHGAGRSAWGSFKVYGRVRDWDGLITLIKVYDSGAGSRGKWLSRGYLVAESRYVGTWRDTFTLEHLNGYEGSFSLRKQAAPFLHPKGYLTKSNYYTECSIPEPNVSVPVTLDCSKVTPSVAYNFFPTSSSEHHKTLRATEPAVQSKS